MAARSGVRAGLPVSLTRLAGRERELAEVARLVHAGRLVTLAGAGGAGKTRLAAEVAVAVPADFGDGVVLADLSVAADAVLFAAVAAPGGGTRAGGTVAVRSACRDLQQSSGRPRSGLETPISHTARCVPRVYLRNRSRSV